MFESKIFKMLFYNMYRIFIFFDTLCPHDVPVPAVAYVYTECNLVYKFVVLKNILQYLINYH